MSTTVEVSDEGLRLLGALVAARMDVAEGDEYDELDALVPQICHAACRASGWADKCACPDCGVHGEVEPEAAAFNREVAEALADREGRVARATATAEHGGGWEPDCGGEWTPVDASRQQCLECGVVRTIPDDCSGEHEGCEGGHVRHLRAYEVARKVELAKREILRDVEAGRVPWQAGSFSELHDYVDANYYGDGYPALDAARQINGEDWAEPDAETDVLNAVQDTVDEWLGRGGLVEAVMDQARSDGLSLPDLEDLFHTNRAALEAERAVATAREG